MTVLPELTEVYQKVGTDAGHAVHYFVHSYVLLCTKWQCVAWEHTDNISRDICCLRISLTTMFTAGLTDGTQKSSKLQIRV